MYPYYLYNSSTNLGFRQIVIDIMLLEVEDQQLNMYACPRVFIWVFDGYSQAMEHTTHQCDFSMNYSLTRTLTAFKPFGERDKSIQKTDFTLQN